MNATGRYYVSLRLLCEQQFVEITHVRQCLVGIDLNTDNFLNLVSTTFINNHDWVISEELRSQNMLWNHAVAMSIADVGWQTLLDMLMYGYQFVTIPSQKSQANLL